MNHSKLSLLSGLALLAVACAPAVSTTHVTSADYRRAIDLEKKGHVDPSLGAFRAAESVGDKDSRDKSIAIYGRANEAAMVGRCREANDAYREYAALVQETDPRSAQMALSYAALCKERVVDPELRAVVTDISFHKDVDALSVADGAIKSGASSPWMDYYRAVALADLKRTNDAVSAFKKAESRLGDNVPARSLAIYGRARALNDAYRCPEATGAYQEYAAVVRPTDPRSADMALAYAVQCR